MDQIWEQFHRLPRSIRDAVARPEALATLEALEKRYPQFDGAQIVMEVMIKSLPLSELPQRIRQNLGVSDTEVQEIQAQLTSGVFRFVAQYLGLPTEPISTPAAAVEPTIPSPQQFSPQPAMGTSAPTTGYSADDDAEIQHHQARLRQLQSPDSASLDQVAQSLLDQHQVVFRDQLLAKRAVAVLKARLKNIRSREDTESLLLRDPKLGGLALDADHARLLVQSLEQVVASMTEGGKTVTPVIDVPVPPAIPETLSSRPAGVPPLRRDVPISEPERELPNVTDPARASRPIMRPADIPPPPPMETSAPVLTTPPPSRTVVKRRQGADRQAVMDIAAPAQTLGPAEEMRSMTLPQFRRLGQGANDVTKKIYDTFQTLQRESFALWSEALGGWRQSEVFRLYLEMGRQSLEQGVSVSQIIQQRATQQVPYLSEHEFMALADLNKRLQL